MPKKTFKYFISYAHFDYEKGVAEPFLEALHVQMKPSKTYAYEAWRDHGILVGEDWDETIKEALKESSGGLLLLSPAFLGSDYIHSTELPALLNNPEKIVLPVMLETINFGLHDLKGLGEKQIYAHRGDNSMKAYAMCDRFESRLFVEELFEQIERRLDKDLK